MNNSKSDNIGYCVLVETDKVKVVKMLVDSFEMPGFKSSWIAQLIGGSLQKSRILLEGVYRQFSDLRVDIFVDDSGILKEMPVTAVTQKGIPLHGNLVILSSDEQGETHLLTRNQVGIILDELGFYSQQRVDLVDLGEVPSENKSEHPPQLKALLEPLIIYCVDNKAQLLTRAKPTDADIDDHVLVMCLHGDSEFIHDTHMALRDFIRGKDRHIEGL